MRQRSRGPNYEGPVRTWFHSKCDESLKDMIWFILLERCCGYWLKGRLLSKGRETLTRSLVVGMVKDD